MPAATRRWTGAWLDALAFAIGIAVAWGLGWHTRDLVWSLWLSSLVIGYAMILWAAFSPALLQFREGNSAAGWFATAGGLALMAFFTVHFGLFHLVHATFLNLFFPLVSNEAFPQVGPLANALLPYCWFLPAAALAERQGFVLARLPPEPARMSVKAADIASRKARQSIGGQGMLMPYRNVVRMHVLIFFFAAVHFAQVQSFFVYAVVYAVYFFPWRLLSRPAPATAVEPG